jgi:hydrogenase maturation protease
MKTFADRRGATIVIGCGNLLCGDDAAGPTLIRRLRDRGPPTSIRCFDAATDAISVIDAIRGMNHVIFVDACSSEVEPGTILEVSGSEAEDIPPTRIALHSVRWNHALAGARRMLGPDFPREVNVWLIEGKHFEPGDPLAPEVDQAIDRLVARLLDDLED